MFKACHGRWRETIPLLVSVVSARAYFPWLDVANPVQNRRSIALSLVLVCIASTFFFFWRYVRHRTDLHIYWPSLGVCVQVTTHFNWLVTKSETDRRWPISQSHWPVPTTRDTYLKQTQTQTIYFSHGNGQSIYCSVVRTRLLKVPSAENPEL